MAIKVLKELSFFELGFAINHHIHQHTKQHTRQRLFFTLMLFVLLAVCGPRAHAQDARTVPVENQPKTEVKTPAEPSEEEKKKGFLPTSIPGFANTPAAAEFAVICENIRATQKDNVKLTSMERRLICGDGEAGQIGTPWAQIPPNEAAYFLKGFLQTRGYHHPEFIQDGTLLFVRTGPISKLTEFRLLGGPENWDPPRRRLIHGEPLTPALLNDLESWALGQIKNDGYACAETEIRADPDTGEVAVFFTPHELKRIRALEESGDTGLRDGALNRYNAFMINGIYRDRLISLTRRRTQDDGFLQTLVLNVRCDAGDAVTIIRDVNLGPARTIRIGIGGSTEEGGRVQAVIRRNRIGQSASSAQARARLSYLNEKVNRQTADANLKWYYLHGEARYYLQPSITFEHNEQPQLESNTAIAKVLHGWNFESSQGNIDLRAGPNYHHEEQTRGPNPKIIDLGYGELGARWTEHDFEWFTSSPRDGEFLDVSYLFATKDVFSKFTAQKIQVTGQKLWQIAHTDPPLFILGTRFDVGSVFTPDNSVAALLPERFLTFIGGERDLRGYKYRSFPEAGGYALSGITGSIEGRFHKVLFRRADIFAFVDAGVLGNKAFDIEKPVYMSPGIGVRWESPFGTLRAYVAKKTTLNEVIGASYDDSLRFGFTFGEEF